jgi:hypothetical protein
MIAERAEQGTKASSRVATMRSLPLLVAATIEIAGTLQPSPTRKGAATPPCRPMR